eukprot:4253452-Pyramimonas_sp.AAC.1
MFAFSPSRFRWPRPQHGSSMAQEGPKRGPRKPQYGPESAQERSKSAPRGDFRGAVLLGEPSLFDRCAPGWSQESPRKP